MKVYVTFGWGQEHEINGKVFDKDVIGVLEVENEEAGRAKLFELFEGKFCTTYTDKDMVDEKILKYCSKGYEDIEYKEVEIQ